MPEFIAFFIYSALNIQLNAAFLFASEASFFGINLYMVAAFEDLMDNFGEIEKIQGTRWVSGKYIFNCLIAFVL